MKRITILVCLLFLFGCDPTWRLLIPDSPYEWVSNTGREIPVGHFEEGGISLEYAGQITYGGIFPIDGDFDVRVTNNNEYPLKINKNDIFIMIDESPSFQLVPKLYKSKDPGIPFFKGKINESFIPIKKTIINPKETILIWLVFPNDSIPSVPKESFTIIFNNLIDGKNSDTSRMRIRFLMKS